MASQEHTHTLSERGAANVTGVDHWVPISKVLANSWSEDNPDGNVILSLAKNALMYDEMAEHITKNFEVKATLHFTYGNGPRGSPRLLKVLPTFFNEYFHPRKPTESHEFLITNGVSPMVDQLTWCICDPGEGILFPQPLYAGFSNDLPTRSRGVVVKVPFEREDGTLDLNDVLDAEANARCLERAFQKSEAAGVKVKAVMVTNPHNPLGRCYPVETLKTIAKFCASHNIHYLSDEIYALSTFSNPKYPDATPFTSVLSIDLDTIIAPELVHVLYGTSKDFCANGLRLGCFYTRNAALQEAMGTISAFSWCPYLVQDMWARVLEDRSFFARYLAENQRRLGKHYAAMTDFLDAHAIPYHPRGNACFFVWADLRKFLRGKDAAGGDLKATSAQKATFAAKESLIADACLANGVVITKGAGCHSEEFGWYRLVFTVEEAALKAGLERLAATLKELVETGRL